MISARTIAPVLVGLALLLPAATAMAQEHTPSPEKLWNAYPLQPDASQPSVARAAPPAHDIAAASPAQRASGRDAGLPAVVPIATAALLAFAAGVAVGRVRRKRAEPPPSRAVVASPPPAAPTAARRLGWRDYPPPPRPAPPPPGAASAAVAVEPAQAAWPHGTRREWRAEIVWQQEDGFTAAVLPPGARPLPRGPVPEEEPELADALRDLEAALETEGWTAVAPAAAWCARRFVWEHPEPPPERGGPG